MTNPERQARKPEWLRVNLHTNDAYKRIRKLMRSGKLHTVCEEAKCPNLHECWSTQRTATFMILGEICTPRCRFCSVKTGLPQTIDEGEPDRVAEAVAEMNLQHVVVTMVNRDDLLDGGAGMMAQTTRAIRVAKLDSSVEVLTSDFMGRPTSIKTVSAAKPDINSHNVETVRRLTPLIRSRVDYDRSLECLRLMREFDPDALTKSSLMLGLGESRDEILARLDDLRHVNVQIVNIGQYLQPDRANVAVQKYWTPEEFAELKQEALNRGFRHCEAGPLVRSSYHAADQYGFIKREDSAS